MTWNGVGVHLAMTGHMANYSCDLLKIPLKPSWRIVPKSLFFCQKKSDYADSNISELIRTILEMLDVFESWDPAPQDGVIRSGIYLLQQNYYKGLLE